MNAGSSPNMGFSLNYKTGGRENLSLLRAAEQLSPGQMGLQQSVAGGAEGHWLQERLLI